MTSLDLLGQSRGYGLIRFSAPCYFTELDAPDAGIERSSMHRWPLHAIADYLSVEVQVAA
jgi:hypothetical protein